MTHSNGNAQKAITLEDAYNIVGGYIDANKETYAKAVEMLKADEKNKEFVAQLLALNVMGKPFSVASKEDLSKVSAQTIEENIRSLEEYTERVLNEIKESEFFKNTDFTDGGKKASDEEKIAVLLEPVNTAVTNALAPNQEFFEADEDRKAEMVTEFSRQAVKWRLLKIRLAAVKNITKKTVKGIKKEGTSFFSKKLATMKKALNPKEKMGVSSRSVISALRQSNVSKLIHNLSEAGYKKAAALVNKQKTRLQSSAMKLAANGMIGLTILTSCGNHGRMKVQDSLPIDTTYQVSPVEQKDTAKTITMQDAMQQKTDSIANTSMQADSISAPTEWNADMPITKSQFNLLPTFWLDKNGNSYYSVMHNNITDEMLEKAGVGSRLEFLRDLATAHRWNFHENRAQVAVIEKYLQGCDDAKVPADEDYAFFARVTDKGQMLDADGNVIEGTLNVRVAHTVGDPCDNSKVVVKNTAQQTVVDVEEDIDDFKDATEEEAKVNTEEEENTSPTYQVVEEDVQVGDTVVQKTVKKDITVQKYKGNTTHVKASDSEMTDPNVDSSVVDGVTVDMDNLLVSPGKKAAAANNAEDDGFTNVAGTMTIIDGAQQDDDDGFTNVSGTTTVRTGAPTNIVIEDDGFVDVDPVTVSAATSLSNLNGKTVSVIDGKVVITDTTQVVTTQTETTILTENDSVEAGTPALGNSVELRGGVGGVGLTAKQKERTDRTIIDMYGTEVKDQMLAAIEEKHLNDKGQMLEGLTPYQSLYTICRMGPWVGGKRITPLINYILHDCDLTKEQMEEYRKDIAKININGSMDGVIGTRNVITNSITVGNDCGERAVLNTTHGTGTVTPTNPSGPKFGRFYVEEKPIKAEPVVTTLNIVEDTREVEAVVRKEVKETDLTIEEYKGNTPDVTDADSKKVKDDVNPEVAKEVKVNTKNLLVSTPKGKKTKTLADVKDAKKKSKKQLAKEEAAKKAAQQAALAKYLR